MAVSGLQRKEPADAAGPTSGQRHQADTQRGNRCSHECQQCVGRLTTALLLRARGGELYVFADADTHITPEEGVKVIRLPEHYGALSPILHVVPLQLLAYHTACARGTDVDKPRNLAKSVTVE